MRSISRNIKSLLFFPLLIIPLGMLAYGAGTFLMTPALVKTSIFETTWSFLPRLLRTIGIGIQTHAGLLAAITVAWGFSKKSITVILTTVISYMVMQLVFTTMLQTIVPVDFLQTLTSLSEMIYPFHILGGAVIAIVVSISNETKYSDDQRDTISLKTQLIQALIGAFFGILTAVVLAIAWAHTINIIRPLTSTVTGPLGNFAYGMFAFLLKPFGVTEVISIFTRYTALGGAWRVPALVNSYVYGTEAIWLSQLQYNGGTFTVGGQAAVEYIQAIFIVPAIGFAMLKKSFVEHRAKVRVVLLVFIAISAIVGFSLPIELIVFFTSPMLFFVMALLSGGLHLIVYLLSLVVDIHIITVAGGGILDLIFFGILPGAQKTGAWVILLVGIVSSVAVYFLVGMLIKQFKLKTFGRNKQELEILSEGLLVTGSENEVSSTEEKVNIMVEGLGGYGNIEAVISSMYRLHIQVKDVEKVEELPIKQSGAAGVFFVKSDVQIIMGALTNEYYNLLTTKLEENS